MVNAQHRVQSERRDHGGKELGRDAAQSHCWKYPTSLPLRYLKKPRALGWGLVPAMCWSQAATLPMGVLEGMVERAPGTAAAGSGPWRPRGRTQELLLGMGGPQRARGCAQTRSWQLWSSCFCFPALTIRHVRNWFQKEAPSSKLKRTPPASARQANIFTRGTDPCLAAAAQAPAVP